MARRDKYEAKHARNRLEYERQIRRIFEETCRECGVSVTKIEALVKSAGEGAVLAEIPAVRRILDKLQKKLKDRLETAVINGIRAEWRLANEKYDALIGTMVAGDLLEKMDEAAKALTMARNLEALEAFIKRKEAGLGLSQRVWHYTGQMREAMETALELGIGEGQSASEIARELKQYLVYPDKLFRRVRDKETGELKLSRPASLFHPGQGVYRSSYKNALRLALNETNIAYRKADTMRRKNLYFVVGIEVHLSNNHNCKGVPEGQFYDICDILQGKYPADFEFVGWHPNCRCWTSSVLQTDDEFIRDSDGVYRGSVNEVKDVPPQFKQWVKDNADRIKSAESRGSLPYFLRDNEWAWRSYAKSIQEYFGYDENKWSREFFDDKSGGYLVVDKDRIENSMKNKQEKAKYEKEYNMAKVFAKNGFKMQMLNEVPRISSPDVLIDGVPADLKKVVANSIEKQARKAIKKQGAEVVLFQFDEMTHQIGIELNKLRNLGIKYKYFITGEEKVYSR